MLCEACRNERIPTKIGNIEPLAGADRLAEVLCEACGELLPPCDATDLYLRRLSRLAAFGLAGGADPILKP